MPERAFITGGSGLFGINFILQNASKYSFYALENARKINLPSIEAIEGMKLDDLYSIESILKSCTPDFVIHAAGMTNLDACEDDPAKANLINGVFSGNLAKVTHELGIKFVHISTDHLFDGSKSFVSEDTPKNPINAYGLSKAIGEDLVLQHNPNALIVRCNFFGWGPSYRSSFSDFIIDNLSNKKRVRLAHDYYYTPSSTFELNNNINNLISRDATGIFNVVGSERVSKYDFGIKLADIFGLSSDLIERVKFESLDMKTRRPSDMSLSHNKLHNFLGNNVGIISQGIYELKGQMNTQLHNKIKEL